MAKKKPTRPNNPAWDKQRNFRLDAATYQRLTELGDLSGLSRSEVLRALIDDPDAETVACGRSDLALALKKVVVPT